MATGAEDKPQSVLAAGLAAMSRLLRRPLASYYLVLGSAGLLLTLGLVMVFSASSVYSLREFGSSYYLVTRQVAWVLAALPVAFLVSRMSPRTIRLLGLPLLLLAIALLSLTYVPGLGEEVRGNRNWIDFGGPFRVQPSELAKLGLVLWGAGVLAGAGRAVRRWKQLVVPFVPVAMIVVALTVGQGDLGTAVVLMGVVLTLLWVVGIPSWLFSLAVGTAAVVGVYFVMAAEHRLDRVRLFLDPFADVDNRTFQAAHSIYAFSNGGWWGRGLGGSIEKWGGLPEAHTDFIFAIIGEELGLPGTFMVIALFLVLGYAGIRIAWNTRDPFVRLASAGITGGLLVQALLNMGSVLAVLPIVGVPLPLVSYGGSALMPMLVAVGVLVSFAKGEPGAQAALAARQRKRPERSGAPRRERGGVNV
ncbi:MAG TPA: putative lipid II flippase FtsW [Jiangellaceae bacterium]|jgi:cell division protein FtsW|nr:putative lipid II flippase FtsW [Jiangellaceae bacterium]